MSTTTTQGADSASEPDVTDAAAASPEVTPDEEEDDSVEVAHAPPRFSQAVSIAAALVAVVLTAPFAILAVPFGIGGLVMVAVSVLSKYSRGWLTAGIGMILFGTLITGGYGTLPAELLLVAVGAALVAWDTGQYGIVLGDQLGREASSQRIQVVHLAASAIVIGVASAFAYLIFLLSTGGQPAPAVAVAVIGIVLLAWTLRT